MAQEAKRLDLFTVVRDENTKVDETFTKLEVVLGDKLKV